MNPQTRVVSLLGAVLCSVLVVQGASLHGQAVSSIPDEHPHGRNQGSSVARIETYSALQRVYSQDQDRSSEPLPLEYSPTPVSFSSLSNSWGTEFVIAFPDNLFDHEALIIVTADTLSNGTVSIPGLSWSQDFTVGPQDVTEIAIPETAEVQESGVVSNLGIQVTADHSVCVYFLSTSVPTLGSCDAYMALPSHALGNEYIILGYPETMSGRGIDSTAGPSQFTLVCTADSSQVTITPSANTLDGRPAGVPFEVTLNRFDTYQLQAGYQQDLSGSEVVSTEPVAVFAGCKCADVPIGFGYADFIVEQMPPVETWGLSFLTSVLTRPGSSGGDPLRILASEPNTIVTFTPPVPGSPFILNRAELMDVTIEGPTEIVADKPVLVAQYATGFEWSSAFGDPFEVLILPTEQFLEGYIYPVPTGYVQDFTNIFVPTPGISSLSLDGSPIDSSIFSPIGSTGYSQGVVEVNDGCHIVEADCPFGVYIFGWDTTTSYACPGGMSVATVPGITTREGLLLGVYSLSQNFPNPVITTTTIQLGVPKSTRAVLGIYDIAGRLVRTLLSTSGKGGYSAVVWDGKDDSGRRLPAGTYFYRLTAGDFTDMKKMVVVR